jgi:broad specificity phosphatase PhoE
MGPFVLVRHARPLRGSSVPPAEWDLDPIGTGAIAELAGALRDLGLAGLRTSLEAKAVQTGRVLADLLDVPMEQDPRLNEVRRPEVSSDVDFIKTAKTYLAGATVAGWESQGSVDQRMHRAVADAVEIGFIALVSHGTAMSIFLERLGLVRAWNFYTHLKTPDGWLVDGSILRRLGTTGDEIGTCPSVP